MTLGHPTTLKAETIREIAKYNTHLHTLSMGGIESFPFMLDCDFSALKQLRHVVLRTTPLLNSAFLTLPAETLRSIRLVQMDAITPENLLQFCQSHARLRVLAIEKCRALTTGLGEALAKLITPNNTTYYCRELKEIELNGHDITDENIKALFINVPAGTGLYRLKLINTSLRSLDILRYSHLRIRHLEVSNNRYLVGI
ncbi:hypothetical protein K501DRAFT_289013 [Backusella circina FSU 941]|nr:hypothetical protein K501DRAFT_289013 [Backusella circina FSU 941]